MKKKTNKILEDHGEWLLIDISTPKHPKASMAIDKDFWDSYDGGRVHAHIDRTSKYIYAYCNIKGSVKKIHKLLLNTGLDTDHITHGSMSFIDNRRSNLREATRGQNNMNLSLRKDNTSGIKGVSFNKEGGNWEAYIQKNGKKKNLGRFDNIEIAIGARQQAEREYYGEYAYKLRTENQRKGESK